MTKRTYLLLAVFIIVVILAGLFIAAYKFYWSAKLTNYAYSLETCGSLSEQQCKNNPNCDPIYLQNNDGNKSITFERCREISAYDKAVAKTAGELCQATGGSWQKLRSGEYCNCVASGQQKVWDKELGCQAK